MVINHVSQLGWYSKYGKWKAWFQQIIWIQAVPFDGQQHYQSWAAGTVQRLFQHTELEHTPKRNLWQRKKSGISFIIGVAGGLPFAGVRYPGVLKQPAGTVVVLVGLLVGELQWMVQLQIHQSHFAVKNSGTIIG